MKHPLLRCFAFYRRHPWLFAAVMSAIVIINLLGPLTTWIFGLAVHDVERGVAVVRTADGFDASRAWHWVAIMAAVTLVRVIAQYLATVLSHVLGQKLLSHMRDLLFSQIQALDIGYHLKHGAGELISRTTRDSDKVRDAVVGGLRTLIELSAIVGGNMAVMFWYDVNLAIVPLALVAISIALVMGQADRMVAMDRESDAAYDDVTQDLSEGVHGVRVIKAFAIEPARIERFRKHVSLFGSLTERMFGYSAWGMAYPQLVAALGHCWVLWYGVRLIELGRINVGELVAATMMMMGIVFRTESIGRILQMFADARASAGRIMELVDARSPIADGAEQVPDGPLGLRLRNVGVRDSEGNVILDGFDADIAPGETVALVGATGCGKSTFASLTPRLRDPAQGEVLVGSGGTWLNVRRARLAQLRRKVQVVFQDSFLFSDSLAANLRMANPQASDAQLLSTLKLVSADDIVAGLPDGLASRVGERGVTLSGGQRQRCCLARALLARPGLLCADDATSALDAVTERRILDNLRAHTGNERTTMILIASKLSTILLADRVLLIDRGRIAAQGTHAELVRDSAAYRNLLGLNAEKGAAA